MTERVTNEGNLKAIDRKPIVSLDGTDVAPWDLPVGKVYKRGKRLTPKKIVSPASVKDEEIPIPTRVICILNAEAFDKEFSY